MGDSRRPGASIVAQYRLEGWNVINLFFVAHRTGKYSYLIFVPLHSVMCPGLKVRKTRSEGTRA